MTLVYRYIMQIWNGMVKAKNGCPIWCWGNLRISRIRLGVGICAIKSDLINQGVWLRGKWLREEWPNGLRHCDLMGRFPVQTPLGDQPPLGTHPCKEASVDL